MQTLLGLFVFCAVLSMGTSLECETCHAPNKTCTGDKQACEANQDACAITLIVTVGGGQTNYNIVKGCDEKSQCNKKEENKLDNGGSITTTVECSNFPKPGTAGGSAAAHSSAASLLLALSAFLIRTFL
ncbi:phospholipase A2 inhibitor and Ly6/PLAUR domain-containing protein-like [Varanus komodoensis]|uniref:phospholipase A2 inhibitor and Ly6/PLAUR domain-containing protein-like n=1 Tax=Varanus komodoensis TaxID=61221 RepID=UPI001CF77F41|nr:phospholipase A2 inhibitor and Ly6/PLAUR domain-containing protein-like [Varanus komodoensis]